MADTFTKINNEKQRAKYAPKQSADPIPEPNHNEVLVLSNPLPGGLLTKNKSAAADQDRPIFKVPALPNKSLLGLDELARKKREAAKEQQEQQPVEKKVRMNWDDDLEKEEETNVGRIERHRPNYRSQRMETPSHGGGISDSALKRMEDMKRKDRNRGTTHYDRDSRYNDRRDDDRRSRDDRYRRDDRREDRRNDRESSRTPSTSSKEGSETPGRRGGLIKRSQWTSMTPSNEGSFTPRMSSGNMTPGRHDSGIRQSTGAATAAAKRTWDYMTPAVRSTAYDEVALEYPEEFSGNDIDRQRWEEEQAQLDREWYQMEDNGVCIHSSIYFNFILIMI